MRIEMGHCVEVESKWTISRVDFEKLLDRCHVLERIDQLNVYFDEHWALANAGATCRVRCAPNELPAFTLKIPVSWASDGTRRAIEIESPARVACAQFSLFSMEFDCDNFSA